MFSFRILSSLLAIFLAWTMLHALILVENGGLPAPSIQESSLFAGLLTVAAWSIGTAIRFYRPNGIKALGLLVCNGVLAFAVVKKFDWIYDVFVGEESIIIKSSVHAVLILSIISFLVLCIYSLLSWVWISMDEREVETARKSATERLLQEAELSGLRQQLQPHFLFNSLNSVNALVTRNPEEARNMIQLLSDFLRGTIRKDLKQKITFEEEISHLRLYLEIEQVRFSNRLQVNISAAPELNTLQLPALLLQPLIENAIKFGLYGTSGTVEIRVSAALTGNMLEITIDNPMDTDNEQKPSGTGFGQQSVQRRLFLLYARNDLFRYRIENKRYFATLRIPQS